MSNITNWNTARFYRLDESELHPYDEDTVWCVDGNWCGKISCPHNPKHIVFIDAVYHWERLKGTDECPMK